MNDVIEEVDLIVIRQKSCLPFLPDIERAKVGADSVSVEGVWTCMRVDESLSPLSLVKNKCFRWM